MKIAERALNAVPSSSQTQTTAKSGQEAELQFLQSLQQLTATQAVAAPTATAPATDVARTGYVTAQAAPTPKGPLLPDSRPSPSALTANVDEAYKQIGRVPTSSERKEMVKLAEELAGKGKNATEIKYAVIEKLRAIQAGTAVKPGASELRNLAGETFKTIFGRAPGEAELTRWAAEAQKLADNGMDAISIKFNLPSMMREVRDGLDKTDTATLRSLAKDAFKTTFGRDPTGSELSRWEGEARKLVDGQKMNATGVMTTLPSMMREVRDGLDKTDTATLRNLAKDAFKTTFGRDPTGSELSRWEGEAKKLVDGQKMNATGVMTTLPSMMREVRDGLDKTDTATLRNLAKDAFKTTFGRDPTGSELETWTQKARKMVDDDKMNAVGVKNTLPSMMREARDGLDRTDRATLTRVLIEAYREVLGPNSRPPSDVEINAWLKKADEMVKDKQSATAIKYAFITGLRIALDNQ
ncbi:hypothetical protein G4177_22545 [Corallococcus sp. ZKHCc1 1396]|uniref:DUF1217 domain-containing protein n=1 Tax=Corallococcus soli TaxID=2710757 RepID=A0ABR9PSS7_9BACT|nr:hypothetical protein [Corallococcus soli]MBE4750955.1 hypothetical protein [Corallococcus soli]